MQLRRIQNNNYNINFCSKYVVKGSVQESAPFIDKLRKNFPCCVTHTNLKLGENRNLDIMLICTDDLSEKAVFNFMKNSIYSKPDRSSAWNSFYKLSIKDQLNKIFGEEEKNIKQYDIKDILNVDFDFVKGIIK